MTKLFDFLNEEDRTSIAKESIRIGHVYRMRMDESNGIKPKSGDSFRNKYFVVLGFDDEGNVYGGVIINSAINQKVPQSVRDWQMPIKREKYNFLDHDSFVDCSNLKTAKIEKFGYWQFLGSIEAEDVEIIIRTVQESPNENKAHLALFGLI